MQQGSSSYCSKLGIFSVSVLNKSVDKFAQFGLAPAQHDKHAKSEVCFRLATLFQL